VYIVGFKKTKPRGFFVSVVHITQVL
jgi:hypothetical protein